MSLVLPMLYKKTSTGADQWWSIEVEGRLLHDEEATIITRYGQVGGKIQEARDVITEGKNIGKANETSPLEQAEAEAKSQWEKKKKKGYVEKLKDARAGKTDDIIEGGVFPMLAQSFAKHGHKITYPAYAQPKFDGHRCIAVIKNNKATLWTRTRKPITGLPHIIDDLEQMAAETDTPNIVLDGELYHHEYRNNFEELTSFIRNPEPKPGYKVVQYHIYDAVLDCAFAERTDIVKDFLDEAQGSSLKTVETISVEDEDDLMLAFDRFVADGYEGAMVRNADGHYEVNKRSYDLQKVKEFQDSEYEIVGVEAGRGKMADKAIFVCKTKDGTEFRVKMKGSLDELKKYVDRPKTAIGRMLTVQYQGITNKSEVPRFPVGLRLREDV